MGIKIPPSALQTMEKIRQSGLVRPYSCAQNAPFVCRVRVLPGYYNAVASVPPLFSKHSGWTCRKIISPSGVYYCKSTSGFCQEGDGNFFRICVQKFSFSVTFYQRPRRLPPPGSLVPALSARPENTCQAGKDSPSAYQNL